jgi:hypothetical protein
MTGRIGHQEIIMKTLIAAILMAAVVVMPAFAASYGYADQQNPPVAHGANS